MLEKDAAAAGLRALLSNPNGVEEAVIGAVVGGSDTERIEGIREPGARSEEGAGCSGAHLSFESAPGSFVARFSSSLDCASNSGDNSGATVSETFAKSTESSGALGGVSCSEAIVKQV